MPNTMHIAVGILAGLAAAAATTLPASTRGANHSQWSISCDQNNKCGYIQNATGEAQRIDRVVARRAGAFVASSGVYGPNDTSEDCRVNSYQFLLRPS